MARELRAAGWSKARALIGGWTAWQAARLPVVALAAIVEEVK